MSNPEESHRILLAKKHSVNPKDEIQIASPEATIHEADDRSKLIVMGDEIPVSLDIFIALERFNMNKKMLVCKHRSLCVAYTLFSIFITCLALSHSWPLY